jgi:hypothetical protein
MAATRPASTNPIFLGIVVSPIEVPPRGGFSGLTRGATVGDDDERGDQPGCGTELAAHALIHRLGKAQIGLVTFAEVTDSLC